MKSLSEIDSPTTLRGKPKTYLVDTGEPRNYIGYSNLESQFPVQIVGGRPGELFVGDDVAAAEQAGGLQELRLKINVANVEPAEHLALQVNGVAVAARRIMRGGETQFTARLEAATVRHGTNHIRFAPGKNSWDIWTRRSPA